MTNEQRPEQQTVPLEVMNAELIARLGFTENRLIAMATVAHNLQVKVDELTVSLCARSEEIAALQADAEASEKARVAEIDAAVAKRVQEITHELDREQVKRTPKVTRAL